MTISNYQSKLFARNPDDYILRMDEKKHLYVEEKGIVTWLKANTFWKDEFLLPKIAAAVRENIESQDSNFLAALNGKIRKYNLNPLHSEKIVDFTAVIEERAKVARYESFQKAKKAEAKGPNEFEVFIQECVREHLRPYFEGKITPKTENKKRAPLTADIMRALRAQFPSERFAEKVVRKVAFEQYISMSVAHFCARFRQELIESGAAGYHDATYPDRDDLKPLIEALQHALAIDFKEIKPTNAQIQLQVYAVHEKLLQESLPPETPVG